MNAEMKRINDIITGGDRTAPELTLKPDKTFEFETPDDKSEGTAAFKSLVVYDLSMLALTPLPVLIHDSSIVKRIEDADFEQILGLYQKSGESGKQVFIAFDKADTYTPNTYKIVDKASVLPPVRGVMNCLASLGVGKMLYQRRSPFPEQMPKIKQKQNSETMKNKEISISGY